MTYVLSHLEISTTANQHQILYKEIAEHKLPTSHPICSKATMDMSPILLLALFSLIYGNGILPIEASHHVYRNLQSLSSDSSNQPYRTAYHFQPPKNWINGIFRSNKFEIFFLTLSFSFLPFIFCAKYFISLTVFCFASCFCHLTCYAEMDILQTLMVSSALGWTPPFILYCLYYFKFLSMLLLCVFT